MLSSSPYHLLALCLVLHTVATDEGRVVPSPVACTHQGKQYQLYSRWPSTKPGDCAEYRCDRGFISGAVVRLSISCSAHSGKNSVHPGPDSICYLVNMPELPYPYCCPRYICVDKDKDN